MNKAVLGVAILIMLAGIWLIIRPQICATMMGFLVRGRMVYLVGLLRLAIGVLLLVSATDCEHVWVVITIGVLFLISGTLVFVIQLDKLKAKLTWFSQRSMTTIRLMALLPLAIGAVMVWACCIPSG